MAQNTSSDKWENAMQICAWKLFLIVTDDMCADYWCRAMFREDQLFSNKLMNRLKWSINCSNWL